MFTGAAMNTYFMKAALSRRFIEDYIPTLIANDKDFLSTRLSVQAKPQGTEYYCSNCVLYVFGRDPFGAPELARTRDRHGSGGRYFRPRAT